MININGRLLLVVLLGIPVVLSAKTYPTIPAIEQALYQCVETVDAQSNCIVNSLTDEATVKASLKGQVERWKESEDIVSILPISTNVVVEDLLIDKAFRISSNRSMAIIQMRLTHVQKHFLIGNIEFIQGDTSVIGSVCGNHCHR